MFTEIKPASKTKIPDNIADQIIELIISGELKPGDKIPPEKDLVEMFQVGRSSVREAVRALSVLGLIDVRVPEGMFVSEPISGLLSRQLEFMNKMSPSNRLELIEVRKKIEVDIVELAAEKATAEDAAVLSEIIDAMRGETQIFIQSKHDQRFHLALGEICRNPFLLQVMLLMKHSMLDWMKTVYAQHDEKDSSGKTILDKYFTQHEDIFKAVARNDVIAASHAMEKHMDFVSERYSKGA